jgi:hypothetical protein
VPNCQNLSESHQNHLSEPQGKMAILAETSLKFLSEGSSDKGSDIRNLSEPGA